MPGVMEQREKSMGAGVSVKAAEVLTDGAPPNAGRPARPARYVAEAEPESSSNSTTTVAAATKAPHPKPAGKTNRLRETRIEKMMSKAELARRANLSVLTIDRVEKGLGCRMDTKRKILEALGLSLADRVRVFGEEE